ncbi:DUF323 domain-containing protein [Fistulina hepatica ATCC 64428]|uniref:DUF323 domain-containing protein n=1 Tax=Fistulina hepatica ATCC 64428 TaxID=1128425 RepID=A0A0D7AC28_9AGAR|nr:DUF323 domain-containing protein [Fistulina hepatica ATCC 64428]
MYPPAHIIDVRAGVPELSVLNGLRHSEGKKTLPTMLLYDERGLRLYDEITTSAPAYYLFKAEEDILKAHANDIVRVMRSPNGSNGQVNEIVLELGSGSLRKTSLLLLGLSKTVQTPSEPAPITYYALDLERQELQRSLGELVMSDVGKSLYGKVDTRGIWGTYDGGLRFIESGGLHQVSPPEVLPELENELSSRVTPSDSESSPPSTPSSDLDASTPRHILFLGSTLGNFSRDGGAEFLRNLPLRPGSGDTLLIGLDHDNDQDLIERAYNDPEGFTRRFIMNGLRAAGRALGDEDLFDEDNWEYVNNYDLAIRRHEAHFRAKRAHVLTDPTTKDVIDFSENELIKIEESYKFSDTDAFTLFTKACLRPIQRWTDNDSLYSLWLLERPPFMFPMLAAPSESNLTSVTSSSPFGVPSVRDWSDLWALWDHITLEMIPSSMLHEKPIDLRHICLFYFGHIPTFLDIHLSRMLKAPHTEPEAYKDIFERGIDPNVDDPTKCHSHSEVPTKQEDWPSLSEILQYQERVRARLLQLYHDIQSGQRALTRKLGRVLHMTYEHEGMHAETLLYMLLQRAGRGTLPPAGFTEPSWESLATVWNKKPCATGDTVTLGPATVVIGHDDLELQDDEVQFADAVLAHEYGWDNESPRREVHVAEFKISWEPVTNGDYFEFWKTRRGEAEVPASWVVSKDGARVLGEDGVQVRTLYGPVSLRVARRWPVIASHDALSTYAIVKGGRLPTEPELRLFMDKFDCGYEGGANVGFRNWHPVPATTGTKRNGGRGTNGGVWEWTSTVLDSYEGFQPSKLYPGYSQDFFDGCHYVVLGGSYATIPRIADRRTFRNWYQRNYPYAWTGARVAYDV